MRNEIGEIIADSKIPSSTILQQGTVSVPNQGAVNLYFKQVVTTAAPPIVAIQVKQFANSYIRLCRVQGSPGNWTHVIMVGARADTKLSYNGSYSYRVYASRIPPSGGFGIQIADINGEVTFDSGSKILKMRDMAGTWQSNFPVFASALTAGGRERIIGFLHPFQVPSNAWLPLSLVNTSFRGTHNAPNGIKPYEAELTFVWYNGQLGMLFWFYATNAPVGFKYVFNSFCPVILN